MSHIYETDFINPRWKEYTIREWQAVAQFQWIRSIVEREVKSLNRKLDFVDIGCGKLLSNQGRYFNILKNNSRSYIGIEPSWAMIRQVPKSNLESLQNAIIVRSVGEELPVAQSSVDVVVSLSTLDHCEDAKRVLTLARDALRPGGTLLLALQNRASWYRRLAKGIAPDYVQRRDARDHHHQFFTYESVNTLLDETGFSEIRIVEQGFLSVPGTERVTTWLLKPLRINDERGAGFIQKADDRLSRVASGYGSGLLISAHRVE